MVNQIKPSRESTFLSHMSPIASQPKEQSPTKGGKTPTKKRTKAKCDWLKYEIIDQCKECVNYLIKIQNLCFVCETEHIDKQGIRIFKKFYVDSEGSDFFDILPTKWITIKDKLHHGKSASMPLNTI